LLLFFVSGGRRGSPFSGKSFPCFTGKVFSAFWPFFTMMLFWFFRTLYCFFYPPPQLYFRSTGFTAQGFLTPPLLFFGRSRRSLGPTGDAWSGGCFSPSFWTRIFAFTFSKRRGFPCPLSFPWVESFFSRLLNPPFDGEALLPPALPFFWSQVFFSPLAQRGRFLGTPPPPTNRNCPGGLRSTPPFSPQGEYYFPPFFFKDFVFPVPPMATLKPPPFPLFHFRVRAGVPFFLPWNWTVTTHLPPGNLSEMVSRFSLFPPDFFFGGFFQNPPIPTFTIQKKKPCVPPFLLFFFLGAGFLHPSPPFFPTTVSFFVASQRGRFPPTLFQKKTWVIPLPRGVFWFPRSPRGQNVRRLGSTPFFKTALAPFFAGGQTFQCVFFPFSPWVRPLENPGGAPLAFFTYYGVKIPPHFFFVASFPSFFYKESSLVHGTCQVGVRFVVRKNYPQLCQKTFSGFFPPFFRAGF